jgi:hypothetical protein
MSEDFLTVFPVFHQPPEQVVQMPPQPADQAPMDPASPDQVQAVDAVFTHERDANLAGLAALWSSTLLLHDLAKEHFHVQEQERLELNDPPPDEDEDTD